MKTIADIRNMTGTEIANMLAYMAGQNDKIESLQGELDKANRPQYSVCNDHPWLTATSVLGASLSCPACELKAAEAKLADAISGLRYIHDAYGRFSGVEWDRMGIEGTDHEGEQR